MRGGYPGVLRMKKCHRDPSLTTLTGWRFEAEGARRAMSSGTAYAPAASRVRTASNPPSWKSSSHALRLFPPMLLRMTPSRAASRSAIRPTAATEGTRSPRRAPMRRAKLLREKKPPSQHVPSPRSVASRISFSMAYPKSSRYLSAGARRHRG